MNKKIINILFVFLLVLSVLTGCGNEEKEILSIETPTQEVVIEKETETKPVETEKPVITQAPEVEVEEKIGYIPPKTSVEPFDISMVKEYSGSPYIEINDNIPYFTLEEITNESFEQYNDLDNLGRCTKTIASIGQDLMPTGDRGSIGMIKPTGWHTVRYDDLIKDKYLYNRCHLIGFQLTGETTNLNNLITGTRYMNVEGMLPFENKVADYVKTTDNHVLYRSTPIFEGDNLLASGVLMEGWSVEDNGEGISFCVFVYNVQPGIAIDYSNGDSHRLEELKEETKIEEKETEPVVPAIPVQPEPELEPEPAPAAPTTDYIINTNTGKFHYPYCSSVDKMKEKNKWYYTGYREDIIDMGYVPCKRCNP